MGPRLWGKHLNPLETAFSGWEGRWEDDGVGENCISVSSRGGPKLLAWGLYLAVYWFRKGKTEEGIIQGMRGISRMNRARDIGAGMVCASKSRVLGLWLAGGLRSAGGDPGNLKMPRLERVVDPSCPCASCRLPPSSLAPSKEAASGSTNSSTTPPPPSHRPVGAPRGFSA